MYMPRKVRPIPSTLYFKQFQKKQHKQIINKNLKLGNVSGKHFFRRQLRRLSSWRAPHLADYEDMLSLQWVTVVRKICPTDGLWVSWPAQLVSVLVVTSTKDGGYYYMPPGQEWGSV